MTPASSPTPEGLAVLACDPTAPRDQRDAAVVCLVELVQEVAGQCAAALHADTQLRRDLLDGSWEHVDARLPRYQSTRGPLVPWLRTVLTRFGHDLRRARRREARRLASLPSRSEGGPDSEEAASHLEASFGRMRDDLDVCAWPPARAVDYYAVLLVLLRLEIAAVCRGLWPISPSGDPAERAARALPWRAAEEVRCFHPGLPGLAEVWHRLSPRLDHNVRLQVVLEALNDPPSETLVGYTRLAQWEHRAREMAEERLGAVVWREHGFARLLDPTSREAT